MKLELAVDQLVIERVQDHITVATELLRNDGYLQLVSKIASVVIDAIENGNKIIFFGNGGSAADAQHLAAELTGRYLKERRALPAMSLTENTSSLTAIGNDYSYELVFARQMEALGNSGDVAIGISTSGNSPNVLRAIEVAKKRDLVTVGFTGKNGGKLRSLVAYCVEIPTADTPRIQEAHILTGHIICELVENGCADE
jgi:D-sedoheptulose 7-phosphate isomerase